MIFFYIKIKVFDLNREGGALRILIKIYIFSLEWKVKSRKIKIIFLIQEWFQMTL